MVDLPPTQYLVMEVLAARARTGEHFWTFPSNLRPAMEKLADRGLIGWKSGIEAMTIQAWLTDVGRSHSLKGDFLTPVQRQLDQVLGLVTSLVDCAERLDASEQDAVMRAGGCGWCGGNHLAGLSALLNRRIRICER